MAVGTASSRHSVATSTPIITDNTTAGAEITTPVDMPRENRNSSAVNERVLASKRLSRYS